LEPFEFKVVFFLSSASEFRVFWSLWSQRPEPFRT